MRRGLYRDFRLLNQFTYLPLGSGHKQVVLLYGGHQEFAGCWAPSGEVFDLAIARTGLRDSKAY